MQYRLHRSQVSLLGWAQCNLGYEIDSVWFSWHCAIDATRTPKPPVFLPCCLLQNSAWGWGSSTRPGPRRVNISFWSLMMVQICIIWLFYLMLFFSLSVVIENQLQNRFRTTLDKKLYPIKFQHMNLKVCEVTVFTFPLFSVYPSQQQA